MQAASFFVLGSFVQACCWTVERLPRAGETFVASGLTVEAGGKGLNVAVCSKRLGAQVEIALGVGEDDAAAALHNLLRQEGVGAQHVHALGTQSGYGAGLIGADGQNAIAVYPGPNLLLNAQHMQQAESTIASSRLVYGQFETSVDAVTQAFHLARQHGVLTVLNPSPWQTLRDELLSATDVLIVNEVEVASLLGVDMNMGVELSALLHALQTAARLWYAHWSGCCLVVTLGGLGSAAWLSDGSMVHVPAYPIEAVDTVGAGDAFASGFLVRYVQGAALEDCLRYGNACGAMVASTVGVLDALPDAPAVARFMQAHA